MTTWLVGLLAFAAALYGIREWVVRRAHKSAADLVTREATKILAEAEKRKSALADPDRNFTREERNNELHNIIRRGSDPE